MPAKFSMAATSMFDASAQVEASQRVQVAMEELKVKHEQEVRMRAVAERQKQEEERRQAAIERAQAMAKEHPDASIIRAKRVDEDEKQEDSEDDDDDYLLDDDPELERLRAARLAQLQKQHQQQMEWKAKGHGELREIVQDEFLREVTSSPRVLVHFYHHEFERCKILDMHLQRLAPRHLECKFLKLNAEKAPFFVEKLQIRVLPTIVAFNDGIAYPQRVVGFENLVASDEEEELELFGSRASHRATDADTFPTIALSRRLVQIGVIDQNDADEDTDAD